MKISGQPVLEAFENDNFRSFPARNEEKISL